MGKPAWDEKRDDGTGKPIPAGGNQMDKPVLNPEVTAFLEEMNHPLIELIEYLRGIILSTDPNLVEGIKWNGPNYSLDGKDRVTLKIYPPKQVQVILHRGAKVKEQPVQQLLVDEYPMLEWKVNDRAVLTFRSLAELERCQAVVREIVAKWLVVWKNDR
jgi:hypothetical protein